MKNQMHKIKIIVSAALFFSLTACSLDQELPGVATVESRFKTTQDGSIAINGILAIMQDYSYYKETWWATLMTTADDLHATSGTYDPGNVSNLTYKNYTPDLLAITNGWKFMYRAIDAANLCISKIPEINGDSLEKQRLIGEARFLRAMNYFNVVRQFGKGIVSLKPSITYEDTNKPFQSKDSIYKIIEEDLLFASKNLPLAKDASTTTGRPTKGAAQGILSLVYLTEEKWQLAYNYADSVILSKQYSLIKDFAQLWNVEKESTNYEENIFVIPFMRDLNGSGMGSIYPYQFCPTQIQGNTGYHVADPKSPLNGAGTGTIKVHCYFFDEYFYDYDTAKGGKAEYTTTTEKDYRIDASFFYGNWKGVGTTVGAANYGKPVDLVIYPGGKGNDPNTTSTGANFNGRPFPNIRKYIDGKGLETRNHENDFIILRFAEIYLIKAEAANELGKTTEAYDAFNKVRERARLANSTNGGTVRTVPKNLATGKTKEEFRLAVLKERGLELIAEGHRWFDLVRMKMDDGRTMYEYRFSDVVNKIPYKKSGAATEASLSSLTSLVYYKRNLLFPIPIEEFNKNTAITLSEQNEGY